MKTILKKTILLETKKFDFENEFSYLEQWSNGTIVNCFFAEKEYLYPDGTIKNGGKKYFFSKDKGEDICKKIKCLDYEIFTSFDKLFYTDEDGEIFNINGSKVKA